MTPVTGRVATVTVMPGRLDELMLSLEGVPGTHLFSLTARGQVTCDGEPVDPPDLFEWLCAASRVAYVTLHPSTERYGLSTKTWFTEEVLP